MKEKKHTLFIRDSLFTFMVFPLEQDMALGVMLPPGVTAINVTVKNIVTLMIEILDKAE